MHCQTLQTAHYIWFPSNTSATPLQSGVVHCLNLFGSFNITVLTLIDRRSPPSQDANLPISLSKMKGFSFFSWRHLKQGIWSFLELLVSCSMYCRMQRAWTMCPHFSVSSSASSILSPQISQVKRDSIFFLKVSLASSSSWILIASYSALNFATLYSSISLFFLAASSIRCFSSLSLYSLTWLSLSALYLFSSSYNCLCKSKLYDSFRLRFSNWGINLPVVFRASFSIGKDVVGGNLKVWLGRLTAADGTIVG